MYFWSLGISLYLELFCFLSFITIVLRNLCSGTHRRNRNFLKPYINICGTVLEPYFSTATKRTKIGDRKLNIMHRVKKSFSGQWRFYPTLCHVCAVFHAWCSFLGNGEIYLRVMISVLRIITTPLKLAK